MANIANIAHLRRTVGLRGVSVIALPLSAVHLVVTFVHVVVVLHPFLSELRRPVANGETPRRSSPDSAFHIVGPVITTGVAQLKPRRRRAAHCVASF